MFRCGGRGGAAFRDSSRVEAPPQLNFHLPRTHAAPRPLMVYKLCKSFSSSAAICAVVATGGVEVKWPAPYHPLPALLNPSMPLTFCIIFYKCTSNYRVGQVVGCIIFFATGRRVSRSWDRWLPADSVQGLSGYMGEGTAYCASARTSTGKHAARHCK